MTIADIETLARFLTNTTTTSLTAANLLILDNKYYEQITGRIVEALGGGNTSYGDYNYTAFPTFTITMSNGVQAYDFGDFTTRPLKILAAEVLDNGGTWHPLNRITLDYIRNNLQLAQSEYKSTNGRPDDYEIRDNLIVLYPAPDNGVSVTLASGLRVFYLRTADVFTSAQVSTGTKTPGFPSPWHYLIAYGAAYDYAIANGMANANQLKKQYDDGLQELLDFVTTQDHEADNVIRTSHKNFR